MERTRNPEQSWVPLQQRAGWAGPWEHPQLLLQLAGTAAHQIPPNTPAQLDFNPGSARANGRAVLLSPAEERTHSTMTARIQCSRNERLGGGTYLTIPAAENMGSDSRAQNPPGAPQVGRLRNLAGILTAITGRNGKHSSVQGRRILLY